MEEQNIQTAEITTADDSKEITFDEMVGSNKAFQAELDRRIEKGINTARSKWEADKQVELENAKTEAAKLAKMNREQKEQYEYDKRIKDLEAREAEISKRELKGQALVDLASKGLPSELAEILNYSDADSCKASMDAVEKAFNDAINKAVEDRLKGSTPKDGGAGAPIDGVEAILLQKYGDTYR